MGSWKLRKGFVTRGFIVTLGLIVTMGMTSGGRYLPVLWAFLFPGLGQLYLASHIRAAGFVTLFWLCLAIPGLRLALLPLALLSAYDCSRIYPPSTMHSAYSRTAIYTAVAILAGLSWVSLWLPRAMGKV